MKEILKKAVLPMVLAIFFGMFCGHVVYKIYLGNNELTSGGNIIYLIQSGAYSSYDNMRINTIGYDYIYYKEDDLYKTIIGVTKIEENIEKIKKSYGNDVIVHEYYTDDKQLNVKLSEYDDKLKLEEEQEKIKEIIIDMLNLYKKEENIKLIKVS